QRLEHDGQGGFAKLTQGGGSGGAGGGGGGIVQRPGQGVERVTRPGAGPYPRPGGGSPGAGKLGVPNAGQAGSGAAGFGADQAQREGRQGPRTRLLSSEGLEQRLHGVFADLPQGQGGVAAAVGGGPAEDSDQDGNGRPGGPAQLPEGSHAQE